MVTQNKYLLTYFKQVASNRYTGVAGELNRGYSNVQLGTKCVVEKPNCGILKFVQ